MLCCYVHGSFKCDTKSRSPTFMWPSHCSKSLMVAVIQSWSRYMLHHMLLFIMHLDEYLVWSLIFSYTLWMEYPYVNLVCIFYHIYLNRSLAEIRTGTESFFFFFFFLEGCCGVGLSSTVGEYTIYHLSTLLWFWG